MTTRYTRCPKCGHQPLPAAPCWAALLTHIPDRVDALQFWFRLATLAGLAVWSWGLIGMDYRTGEMGTSFIHRPILVFHEAGHLIFMPLGHWLMVLGGTLGRLGIAPAAFTGGRVCAAGGLGIYAKSGSRARIYCASSY